MTKYIYDGKVLPIKNCPLCNFTFSEKKIKWQRSLKGDLFYYCQSCLKFNFIDNHSKNTNSIVYIGLNYDPYYFSFTKTSDNKIYFSEDEKENLSVLDKERTIYDNMIFQSNEKFKTCESFKTMIDVVEFIKTNNVQEFFQNIRMM